MAHLQVEQLSISFGGLKAVNDVSFEVEEGAIHGLIGPNGAGKTTIFNCVSGVYKPHRGRHPLCRTGPDAAQATPGGPMRHRADVSEY